MQTIVLNADYTYLNTVSWKRGLKLLLKNKAIVLKESEKLVSNFEKTVVINIPIVLKLIKIVNNIYKHKIPYSKKGVLCRDKQQCQYCGSLEGITIDHITPVSRGGRSSFLNCVACCTKCNLKKDNRTPEEANMLLLKRPFEPSVIDFILSKMRFSGIEELLVDLKIF